MFGLEDKKKEEGEELLFDIEREIKKDPKRARELRQQIESRIQKIKEVLRTGDDREVFDRLGTLLHGYNALLKVLSRVTAPPKTPLPKKSR